MRANVPDRLTIRLEPHRELGTGSPQLVAVARVDGELLADPQVLAIDLDALRQSMSSDGEFPIFTCWCGDANCGGVWEGVWVDHDGRAVRWHMPNLRSGGPPRHLHFTFDQEQYQMAILSVTETFAVAAYIAGDSRENPFTIPTRGI